MCMIYGYDYIRRHIEAQGHYDEQGDWVIGEGEWDEPIRCDIQHPEAGKATILRDEAGKATEYGYVIWLEASVDSFALGERLLLGVGGEPEVEYSVKGFRRYRTHCKVWV